MNRHLWLPTFACIAIAAMMMPRPAHAATFDADLARESCQLRLTGAIERGDLDRLKAKLPADFDPHMKGGPEICLNSEGGDFVEGLRIAEYVSNGLSTRIEKGAVCASACGWIFLAGLSISTGDLREWSRTMDAHAQLAFHAPYIDPAGFASAAGSGEPVAFVKVVNAYNQAVGEIAKGLLKLAQKYDSPPTSPLVPPTLLAEALVKVGHELLVVDTTGAAVRWRIKVEGHGGIVPRSKQDIVRACLLASWQANAWPPDFLSTAGADLISNPASPDFVEYLAYYDAAERTLTAQVFLDVRGNIACELQFSFNDDLSGLWNEQIIGTANLAPNQSLGRDVLWGSRTPTPVTVADFSVLPQDTRLKDLPAKAGGPVDLKALVTLAPPDWCRTQQAKKPDEKAVCGSAKLSALDSTLNRFFRDALGGDAKAKAQAQVDQRTWLAKRQLCGDDAECLEQTYRTQIAKLRLSLPH